MGVWRYHMQKLKEELSNAIAAEDYEKAAKIKKAMEKLDEDKEQHQQ